MDINYRALLKITKHFRTLTFLWFLAVILITCALSTTQLFTSNSYLSYIFFIVVFPLFFIAIRKYKKNITDKIDSLLLIQCDPESYLSIYGNIVMYLYETDINTDLAVYDFDPGLELYWFKLIFGIIESGGYEEALEMLEEYKLNDTGRDNKLNYIKAEYYSNLFSAHMGLKEIEKAEKDLDGLIKAVASLSTRSAKKYNRVLMSAQYRYNIAIGRFDYAEKAFTEAFDKAENPYERVSAKFYLGEAYLHNGDTARARESFEYVMSNGGNLYIVEEAKTLV